MYRGSAIARKLVHVPPESSYTAQEWKIWFSLPLHQAGWTSKAATVPCTDYHLYKQEMERCRVVWRCR